MKPQALTPGFGSISPSPPIAKPCQQWPASVASPASRLEDLEKEDHFAGLDLEIDPLEGLDLEIDPLADLDLTP
jgi:hypothetical protein